jgi:hypothetical protein
VHKVFYFSPRKLRAHHCSSAYSTFACFRMGTVGAGVFQCGIWSLCAKNWLWHSFAADSNPSRITGIPDFAQRCASEIGRPGNAVICCQPFRHVDFGLGFAIGSPPHPTVCYAAEILRLVFSSCAASTDLRWSTGISTISFVPLPPDRISSDPCNSRTRSRIPAMPTPA